MAEPPAPREHDESPAPSGPPPARTPRWVKVFGIVLAAVILLLAVALLTGGHRGHGPERHLPSGGLGDPVPGPVSTDVPA